MNQRKCKLSDVQNGDVFYWKFKNSTSIIGKKMRWKGPYVMLNNCAANSAQAVKIEPKAKMAREAWFQLTSNESIVKIFRNVNGIVVCITHATISQ